MRGGDGGSWCGREAGRPLLPPPPTHAPRKPAQTSAGKEGGAGSEGGHTHCNHGMHCEDRPQRNKPSVPFCTTCQNMHGGWAGMHWRGGAGGTPPAAQPTASHCLPDAKCRLQQHLYPTVTAPNRFGTFSNRLSNRFWGRLWGPSPWGSLGMGVGGCYCAQLWRHTPPLP